MKRTVVVVMQQIDCCRFLAGCLNFHVCGSHARRSPADCCLSRRPGKASTGQASTGRLHSRCIFVILVSFSKNGASGDPWCLLDLVPASELARGLSRFRESRISYLPLTTNSSLECVSSKRCVELPRNPCVNPVSLQENNELVCSCMTSDHRAGDLCATLLGKRETIQILVF